MVSADYVCQRHYIPIITSTGTIHVLHVHAYNQVVFVDSDFSEGGRGWVQGKMCIL